MEHLYRRVDAKSYKSISVVGISGFQVDRKVQAVDDDGNGVSWTSDVFNAIKPEEVGSLVRFDFSAESSAKSRFFFWP